MDEARLFETALNSFEQLKAEEKAALINFMRLSDEDELIELADALTLGDRDLAPIRSPGGALTPSACLPLLLSAVCPACRPPTEPLFFSFHRECRPANASGAASPAAALPRRPPHKARLWAPTAVSGCLRKRRPRGVLFRCLG